MRYNLKTMTITFDKNLRKFISGAFDVIEGEDGVLVEKGNPKQKVLTKDGKEIEFNKFGGVRKGSEIFIRSDIVSLIQLCDDLKG